MDFNDIFNREQVNIDLHKNLEYIKNKRILVTGAGGTIGGELSRQMLYGGAQRLYIFDHAENALVSIYRELNKIMKRKGINVEIVPILGELQDRNYIFHLIKRLHVDVIFHAAAHKHVIMGEENPVEIIKNNVFGTKYIVEAAKHYDISKFIFISTDKAVEPVCVYGVSKKLGEEIVLNAGRGNKNFLVVRFGNVFASNGSIFNVFKEQIENNEPLTITDKRAKRFFMSLHEAVSLVLKIGKIGFGNELYVLEMGEQINIFDIAQKLLSYYNKPDTYPIEIIGLGQGEKLEEKLWDEKTEEPSATEHEKIIRIKKLEKMENIDKILIPLYEYCFYDQQKKALFRGKKLLREFLHIYFPTLRTYDDEDFY